MIGRIRTSCCIIYFSPGSKLSFCLHGDRRETSYFLTVIRSFHPLYAPYAPMVQGKETKHHTDYTKYLHKDMDRDQTVTDYTKKRLTVSVGLLAHLRHRLDYVALPCCRDGYGIQSK